jgi:hypothetical protein
MRWMGSMRCRLWCAALVLLVLAACGRFGPPLPPEALAPKAVEDLTAVARPQGVSFAWSAPDRDRRSRELKFIDGYRIQRKELSERGDETNPDVVFEDVGFVKDNHVEVREELRKEARAQGKVGRRIQAPKEATQFTFKDTKAEVGKTYMYQILPENQGGVKGVVNQIVKVAFRGDKSDVRILDSGELEEETDAAAAAGGAVDSSGRPIQ